MSQPPRRARLGALALLGGSPLEPSLVTLLGRFHAGIVAPPLGEALIFGV